MRVYGPFGLVAAGLLGVAACALHAQTISDWAFGEADHRLHYRYDARGNSIMDFSSAGYRAGGVKLPSATACQRLTPASGARQTRECGFLTCNSLQSLDLPGIDQEPVEALRLGAVVAGIEHALAPQHDLLLLFE